MLVALIKDENGVTLGMIPLAEKTFASGSTGHFGQSKITGPAGERLQVQVTAVIIGSKGETKAEG